MDMDNQKTEKSLIGEILSQKKGASIVFTIILVALAFIMLVVNNPYDYNAPYVDITGRVIDTTTVTTDGGRRGTIRSHEILHVQEITQEEERMLLQITSSGGDIERSWSPQYITIRYYPGSTNHTVWIDPPYAPYDIDPDEIYEYEYDALYFEITGQVSYIQRTRNPYIAVWFTLQEEEYRIHDVRYPGTSINGFRLRGTDVVIRYYPDSYNTTRIVASTHQPYYPPRDMTRAMIIIGLSGAFALIWVVWAVVAAVTVLKSRKQGEAPEAEDSSPPENELTIESTDIIIKVTGPQRAPQGQPVVFEVTQMQNNFAAHFEEFYWMAAIPADAIRVNKLTTGTYNENLQYDVVCTTNFGREIIVVENLSTTTNNTVELAPGRIGLSKGEHVIEIALDFDPINTGFATVENPQIFADVLPTSVAEFPPDAGFMLIVEAGGCKYVTEEWVVGIDAITITF